MGPKQKKKQVNKKKAEVITIIGFSILLFILSSMKIVYVPISENAFIDLSIIPAMFVAMIGGYRIAVPIGLGWFLSSILYVGGEVDSMIWTFFIKESFVVFCAYFYSLFKKAYQGSPWNVYRTIFASVTVKNLVAGMSMLALYPYTYPDEWMKNSALTYIIELAICILAMSLLIEKLRQVHILNGVKRREKC